MIVGAAVTACWLWILGLVVGAAQASSPQEAALLADLGRLIAGAALVLPATAAAAWTVRAAWRAPWIPSPPDVAWLTQQAVSIISWSVIELAKRIVVRAIAYTCAGYLVAAFALASAGGAPTLPSCLPYGATLGLACSAAYAIAWVIGITRLRLGRSRRLALTIVVLIGAAALVCVAAVLFTTCQNIALDLLHGNLVPLLGASIFFIAAILFAAGALIAPLGAALLSGTLAQASTTAVILGGETGARILGAASWILLAINSSDAPRTLARVFIADTRNRFFREHLPVSTQVLFAWDVLPGLIVATLSSIAVSLCMEALGVSADKTFAFVLCAIALDVSFACIGALDVVDLMPKRVRLTCESATAILAVVIAAASALMPNAVPLAFWIGTVATATLAAVQLR